MSAPRLPKADDQSAVSSQEEPKHQLSSGSFLNKPIAGGTLLQGLQKFSDFPAENYWMLAVDGNFYKSENGAVGIEERTNGYVNAVLNTLAFAVANTEEELSVEFIKKLHHTVMQTDKPSATAGKIRTFQVEVWARGSHATPEGLAALMEKENPIPAKLAPAKCEMQGGRLKVIPVLNSKNQLDGIDAAHFSKEKFKAIQEAAGDASSAFCYIPPIPGLDEDLESLMQKSIERFKKNLPKKKNQDDQIAVIAQFIQQLNRIHPFEDGNNRVFVSCLLNSLLIKIGCVPTVLFEPNIFEFHTVPQLVKKIKEGMEITKKIISDPAAPVFEFANKDLPEELKKRFEKGSRELNAQVQKSIAQCQNISSGPGMR
jgi:hypothetical protein